MARLVILGQNIRDENSTNNRNNQQKIISDQISEKYREFFCLSNILLILFFRGFLSRIICLLITTGVSVQSRKYQIPFDRSQGLQYEHYNIKFTSNNRVRLQGHRNRLGNKKKESIFL